VRNADPDEIKSKIKYYQKQLSNLRNHGAATSRWTMHGGASKRAGRNVGKEMQIMDSKEFLDQSFEKMINAGPS